MEYNLITKLIETFLIKTLQEKKLDKNLGNKSCHNKLITKWNECLAALLQILHKPWVNIMIVIRYHVIEKNA